MSKLVHTTTMLQAWVEVVIGSMTRLLHENAMHLA
jgi:hypothetical protein